MLDTITLRKAMYARLAAALAPTPVFSAVPAKQPFPYVRLGDIAMADDGAKDAELHDYDIALHAFTRDADTPLAVETLLGGIYAALHEQEAAIVPQAGKLVLIRCEMSTSFQQAEGQATYWHGVQRYRAVCQDI